MPNTAEQLTEKRVKITTEQDKWLDYMNEKYHIQPSILVRMAIDCIKPRFDSFGATEEGIVNVCNKY